MLRNTVVHLNGEQPVVADLFDMPATGDLTLRCTNVRTLDGKRPTFVDHQHSVFFFPYEHIRFVEIPPSSLGEGDENYLPVPVGARSGGGGDERQPAEAEADLEIDEDFLRRIREV
jgi:hypothetical protein